MTAHLSPDNLNALVDGELSAGQLALVNDHLALCPECTSHALGQTLLKANVARAGHKYAMPAGFEERIKRAAASGRTPPRFAAAVAAILLVIFSGLMLTQQLSRRAEVATIESKAQASEVIDLHIATLAAGLPPQVVSSDRHTVKPWFQGKLPFSFNLPDNLPNDTKLDGANLTYLHNQPAAQLLYTIGKHHVSVFLEQRKIPESANETHAEQSGFKVTNAAVGDLNIVAVSDVDPSRLAQLLRIIKDAQTTTRR